MVRVEVKLLRTLTHNLVKDREPIMVNTTQNRSHNPLPKPAKIRQLKTAAAWNNKFASRYSRRIGLRGG